MSDLVWSTQKRKINELIPYEQNPRQMTEVQVEQLKKSLEKFNLVEIPAIDTDNKIVAGHQRLKIMQMLGRGNEEIDVRVPNRKLTEAEFQEYNIRSNKNTGEWDYDLLAGFDTELLLGSGFTDFDLKNLLGLQPNEDDWAEGFEKDTLPKELQGLKQVTFVLKEEEVNEVLELLKNIDPDRNIAFYKAVTGK